MKWQYIDNKKQTRLITLFPKQAQCAMAANRSFLGSVGSLLPVQVALKALKTTLQWTFMTNQLSQQGSDNHVWYTERPRSQWPRSSTDQIFKFIHTKLQNQGACDWGPLGPTLSLQYWKVHISEAGIYQV